MFVLTIDQQASTRKGDRVPELLARLEPVATELQGIAFPFERTVGDEVQVALTNPESTVVLIREVLRAGGWSIGLGIGATTTPAATSSRAAAGPAFVHARTAVERAKRMSSVAATAVEADDATAAQHCEALLQLLGAVIGRRTVQGWEVIDALQPGPASMHLTEDHARSQQQIAETLGITRQAVSQRLQTALWAEEVAALPLAAALLEEAS